jgi:hypothetical protein
VKVERITGEDDCDCGERQGEGVASSWSREEKRRIVEEASRPGTSRGTSSPPSDSSPASFGLIDDRPYTPADINRNGRPTSDRNQWPT